MKKGSFEAKKHAYRQTQDGIVISFVVHPDDISPELATAPLGTIYMIGYARIDSDGKPASLPDIGGNRVIGAADVMGGKKERTPFETLQPSAQAAILANDGEFQAFLSDQCAPISGETPTETVRRICEVESRSQFNTDPKAANRWEVLKRQFKQFQTDARYAESRTH